MELNSLFLCRINSVPPPLSSLPSTVSFYTIHIAAPGADDTCQGAWWSILIQIWHEKSWENLDQMINGRQKSTFNAVLLLDVYACLKLRSKSKHNPQIWTGTWTEVWGWHFTCPFWNEYRGSITCRTDSPSGLSMKLIIKTWIREMLVITLPPSLCYRVHGQQIVSILFLFL